MTAPAEGLALTKIERTNAADGVRAQLFGLIESGALTVGDKLPSEHELARSLGVSRPVIREALGALRAAGVLESRPGSGTYVTSTTLRQEGLLLLDQFRPEDLYEVRAHLEIPGAGLAAQRRTAQQLVELEAIVAGHADRPDAKHWVDDDLRFHVLLAEATGNELQVKLIRELREAQLEQNVAIAGITDLEAPAGEHEAIVRAIAHRDSEAAEQAMADHLEAILARSRAATG